MSYVGETFGEKAPLAQIDRAGFGIHDSEIGITRQISAGVQYLLLGWFKHHCASLKWLTLGGVTLRHEISKYGVTCSVGSS